MKEFIIEVNFEVADFKNSRAAVDFICSVGYCLALVINSAKCTAQVYQMKFFNPWYSNSHFNKASDCKVNFIVVIKAYLK